MRPLVSVIVPVYNAEKYLKRCLESILSQTYCNYEVILIDDGSTDNSKDIVNKYQSKDDRIIYLYQENEGNTSARKRGVNIAKGEYLIFVDADDWIEKNCIDTLLKEMLKSNADLVMSNLYRNGKTETTILKQHINYGIYNNPKDIIPNMIYNNGRNGVIASLSGKMYTIRIAKKGINAIDKKLNYGEDYYMTFWCILNAQCISVIDDAFYHYEENPLSYSNTFQEDIFFQMHLFYTCSMTLFREYGVDIILKADLQKCIMGLLNRQIYISSGELYQNSYIFPELNLKNNTKIILYGAGKVGREFYRQIHFIKEIKIVAWVDKKADEINIDNVEKIEVIDSVDYDYIIIAVANKKSADIIANELEKRGISKDKIIWRDPLNNS